MRREITLCLSLFFGSLALVCSAFSQGQNPYGHELFEQHGSVMLLINPQSGAIVNANPAAAQFYGYSVEELKQSAFSRWMAGGITHGIYPTFRTALIPATIFALQSWLRFSRKSSSGGLFYSFQATGAIVVASKGQSAASFF